MALCRQPLVRSVRSGVRGAVVRGGAREGGALGARVRWRSPHQTHQLRVCHHRLPLSLYLLHMFGEDGGVLETEDLQHLRVSVLQHDLRHAAAQRQRLQRIAALLHLPG